MNGYQIDTIINSLSETKYSYLGCFKNDTIPFKLQLKRNGFFLNKHKHMQKKTLKIKRKHNHKNHKYAFNLL